jgi:hypothetical protein
MSLATSGGIGGMGGAGGGGLTMAHSASVMARPNIHAAPPPDAGIPSGMAPPSSANAALGADLVDKQQQLSLKQVKDLSHLPLVALDLYGKQPHVASFPPKVALEKKPELIGKMKDQIILQATEKSHKTFRKWLSKSKTYADLQVGVFGKADDSSNVILKSPQKWLGLRRLEDAPTLLTSSVNVESNNTPAIAEEASSEEGVVMVNGSLDGSVPQGDDFDRVVAQVRLHKSKKALTVLPEEATQLLLAQAQHHVGRKHKEEDEDEISSYPCCVAVPAPYCTDSAMEALLDATDGSGVMFQRSTCALAGALLPSSSEEKPNLLIEHIGKVMQAMHKEYQKALVQNPDARFEEDQLILLTGLTSDTVECTAIQISSPQRELEACCFGNFKVLANVSKQVEKPSSQIQTCISDIYDVLDATHPEADGPVAMVSYGSTEEQNLVKEKWEKLKSNLEDWEEVPHIPTKADAVAMGTSVLGAVSHGRLLTIHEVPGKKPKAQLAIRVQNVAPVAVGVRMNYEGGAKNKWLPVKTIFDFDRRVPAGPYKIELNAAKCAVNQSTNTGNLSEEDLLKAIQNMQASKCIPNREQAALDFRLQIVQKWTRAGEWKNIGDVMSPLVTSDRDEKKIACEMVSLDLSLSALGLITHSLVGERCVIQLLID